VKNTLYFNEVFSKNLIEESSIEANSIGFYNLPNQKIDYILDFAKNITHKYIAVIGIGGSSLGTEAIYSFLNSKNSYDKKLIFFDTTDPITIENRLLSIDLKSTLFIIISKSGTTVESISILKYLNTKIIFNRDNLIVITDKNSPLEKFGESENLQIFNIPDNVGGRYSVLSVVGLIPLAIIGVDIRELLKGAKNLKEQFFTEQDEHIFVKKAIYYAKKSDIYSSNCLFSYSEIFRGFNRWYVQLWAESLGKKQIHSKINVGLTPIGLIGPTDQHSFLQLIMEGKADKTVTVIKIEDFGTDIAVPDISLKHLETLDIVNNIKFADLINLQAEATIEALDKIEVPLDVIKLSSVSEKSIGELIYYYELLTALVARQLDVNAYNQPGVELGKIILKNKMANF